MTEYLLKLSPIVKEEELIAMGFVKSLGKFFGGFEEKKGVQVCLAIDFETKLVWITANNYNIDRLQKEVFEGGNNCESEDEFYNAREVEQKYGFDLGFKIPQVLLQMLMTSQINITKKEGKQDE